ncbi:hypothetical protein [Photobacterium toruni]|uniref:hypothetical protein n=1 Tax=Photobacterium toruni TaxID=1935446 RepID=UPI00210FE90F|nr:hypothetical protein [Photobacterium toruni]
MYFKKSILATALLSVLALSGCNSGDSDTATSTTAIHAGFPNVKMCLTSNPIACDNKGVTTNNEGIGQLVITAQDKDKTILVTADEHTFSAPATSTFVTPITTLVVNAMKKNKDITVVDAEDTIKYAFSTFIDKYPNTNIFRDSAQNPVLDKIVNALADTSVNYNSIDIADLVNKAMDESETSTSVPVIQKGGSTENIEQPQLSQVAKTIKPQTLKIEDQIQPIDLTTLFTLNGDNSALTYDVEGMPKSLTNKDNTIEGAITLAGTFSINVVANNNGALSQPVTLKFKVTPVVPNAAPTLKLAGQTELQNEANSLQLKQGEPIGDDVTYAISDLFNDVDGDQLKITSTFKSTKTNASNGITVTEKDGQLVLSGTPAKADEMTLTISANDGVNKQSATAIIKLNVAAVTPNAAPTLIKAGQTELQNNADSLQLTQGEPIDGDVIFPVSHLFSDVDTDTLTVTAKFKATGTNASNGITVTQKDDDLILSGTPIEKGEMTLTLLANDGVNAQSAKATITFDIAEGEPVTPVKPYVITPESIKKDFIDGKKWYMTSYLTEESAKPMMGTIVDGSHIKIIDPDFGGIYTFNVDKSNRINIPEADMTLNIFYSSSNIILASDPTTPTDPLTLWLTHPINNQIAKGLQTEQLLNNTYYYLNNNGKDITVQSVTLTNENMPCHGKIDLYSKEKYNIIDINQKDGTVLLENEQDTANGTINLNILFTNQQTAQSIANKWNLLLKSDN